MDLKIAAVLAGALFCGTAIPLGADAQIEPAGDGMFLCPSPVIAAQYWRDLNTAASAGVKLNRLIAENVAAKNGCRFVRSKQLKPVRYVAGQLGISDGSGLGWAAPEMYIIYVNSPPAASN